MEKDRRGQKDKQDRKTDGEGGKKDRRGQKDRQWGGGDRQSGERGTRKRGRENVKKESAYPVDVEC